MRRRLARHEYALDQVALELPQGSEEVEGQASAGRGGVDRLGRLPDSSAGTVPGLNGDEAWDAGGC
jgi:hypothetical protein